MIVIYSGRFKRKIKLIYKLKAMYSYNSYKKMDKQLTSKVNVIKMFPKAYPKLIGNGNFRKIIIDKYIIIYSVSENIVSIDDIIHQKSKRLNNLVIKNPNKNFKN